MGQFLFCLCGIDLTLSKLSWNSVSRLEHAMRKSTEVAGRQLITGMILSRKGDLCDIYGQSWQYLVASLYLQGFRLPAKQTNSNFVLSRKMEVATTTGFHYGTFKGGASLKTVLLVLLILPFLYLTANQSLAQDTPVPAGSKSGRPADPGGRNRLFIYRSP